MDKNHSYNYAEAVEVTRGIYWVGSHDPKELFHCNPYLLVDGEEAVLFDPGGVTDYSEVARKVFSIVKPAQIRYVVLHHQDPDLCASAPLLEEAIDHGQMKIVAHSRASVLIGYYGIESEFYLVDKNHYSLTLKSGRILRFLTTPFCHFPAAIVTYDEREKVLFSSDLFGAISPGWSLFAKEGYEERMRVFHVGYMASTRHLSKVMERMATLDLEMILPQHGSIIPKEMIPGCIDFLKSLPCGIDAQETEEELYGWIRVGKADEKKHILIVEDNGKSMKLLRDILTISGYVTIEADDGRKAVELAKEKKPDLILMDIQLPILDGLEATKLIKADPATQNIPIFALTAFAMGGDRERFIQAGCDDYVSKPYNIGELLGKVKNILAG
ncbi:MAG: response regulator [Syntrophales bacterium]|nr:response regulator [Syntrophales bacterium]MDP3097629.1 response regulator [Syntrophales bacterium]